MHPISRRTFLQGSTAIVALPAGLAACADDSAARAGIDAVPTPGGGIVPSAQFDAAGDLQVAYLQGKNVFLSQSRDAGATFAAAVRVNDRPGFAQGGLFRGPEMALDGDGGIHVVWYSGAWEMSRDKSEQGAMYARALHGAAFEASRNIGKEPSDGFSVAARAGQVAIAWHNGELLKVVRSDDAGATFSAATPFEALPCDCCATTLRIAPAGQTVIVYRDRKDDHRDMYVAALDRGKTKARRLRLDSRSWIIDACPLSGCGVVLRDEGLTAAWEHDGEILMSRVDVAAWQRSEPVALGRGKYPLVLANADRLLVAWSAGKELAWQSLDLETMRPVGKGSVRRATSHRAAGAVSPAGRFVLIV